MSSGRWSRVSNEPLDSNHLGLVMHQLVPVQHKWKVMGAVLGLPMADLECIELERQRRPSECLLDMLDKWLKQGYDTALYGEPSWLTLVTRLENTIDDQTCLKQIQEQYSSSEEPRAINVDSDDDESMASDYEESNDEESDDDVGSCTSIQSTENQRLLWPFHCGCGHCTEDSLSQCPQRAKSDEAQLLATITNCTLATAEGNNSLPNEVRLIEKEFQLLFWKTWNHLRKVDLKDLVEFLPVHLHDLWKLSREEEEKIHLKFEVLKNHMELLKIIGSYISWYNYHLLHVTACLFLQASEALLMLSWDAYKDKIQALHARLVQTSDNVIQFGSAQDQTSTVLLLKLTHSSFPLQLMHHIQEILGKDLGISPHLFYLVSIDASRLEATYKIYPQKLVIQTSQEFADAGITDIKFGDADSVRWELKKSLSTQSLSKVLHFRNILSSKGIDADSKWSENNSTALHRACWRGHRNEAEWIAKRFDYNRFHCGRNGWTPAHAAVWGGHLDTVQYLLEDCSTSPTVCDDDQVSLLHIAAYKGHTDIAQYLTTKYQLDPDAPDINDITPLLQAIHGGSVETFEALLSETDRTSMKQVTKHGVSATLLACKSGSIAMLDRVASILSITGAAVLDNVDNKHQNCLHYAVCSNNRYMLAHVQKLLNAYILPLTLTTALAKVSAIYCSDTIITEFVHIIKKEDIIELFRLLCEGVRLTRDEMQCHIDLTSTGEATTSHSVPVKKQLDQAHVMMILIKEAELNSSTIIRISHSMCSSGNIQAVKLLREKFEINLNCINDVGESTLHQAAASGSTYLLKYMQSIDIKSDVDDASHNGNLPIHKACMSGSCNAIEFLAKQRESTLQKRNKEGLTPLLVACKHGHYNAVVLLVEQYNCQLTDCSKYDLNCLHYAALYGNKKLFMYLEQNMSIRNAAKNGSNVLHFATASGNLSLVKHLIKVHKCIPTKENAQGRQPIHLASLRGHKHVFKYLWMEQKCDVGVTDNNEFTPLHLACLGGHLHLVTYLTDKLGFNIRKLDGNPYQLVHLACESGCLPLVKSLVMKGCNPHQKIVEDGTTSLHRACLSHNVALIEWLIQKHNCKANIKNKNGLKPIYWACSKGCLEVVKYMIEVCRCDVRFKTKEGYTCLHTASRHGHIDVVKYLDRSSKCNIKYSGQTVLHEAAMGGHVTLLHHLISLACCDPSAKCSRHGRTCLHYAVEYGHLHLAKFLVNQYGVKVDAQDNEGASPLHIAALTNQLDILKYLVDIGMAHCSDTIIMITDYHDNTLLHYAASSGHLDIARYLVGRGLSHCQVNKQGRTPLHDAEQNEHKDTARYLKSLRISYIN